MVIIDALLVIVFAVLAAYYGMQASRQRAAGDRKARWSVATAVLLGLAAIAWGVALVIEAT